MVLPTSDSSLIPFMLVVALAVYAAQALAEGKTHKELNAVAVDDQRHPPGPFPSTCTDGFFSIPGSAKSYYFIRNITRGNWTEAKQMCEDELQLAEPQDTVPIVEWIYENCGDRYSLNWLGARGNGSSFIWQHRGQAIDNKLLMSSPSLTTKDHCLSLAPPYFVGILNGTFFAYGCSTAKRYGSAVCEVPETTSKNCEDKSNKCQKWTAQGKCSNGNIYFKCKSSCACGPNSNPCTDRSNKCPKWANQGKCNKKKVFNKCKSSCACSSDTA